MTEERVTEERASEERATGERERVGLCSRVPVRLSAQWRCDPLQGQQREGAERRGERGGDEGEEEMGQQAGQERER